MRSEFNKYLQYHVPQAIYETFARYYGIDLKQYPYVTRQKSPNTGFHEIYAVFNYDFVTVQGQRVGAILLTYKNLRSKEKVQMLIYIPTGTKEPKTRPLSIVQKWGE